MLITDVWKQRMYQAISTAYPQYSPEKINSVLDGYVQKAITPDAQMRNLYRGETFNVNLNEMMELIEQEHLSIGANGTYTYHPRPDMKNIISEILIDQTAKRKHYRDLRNVAIEKGDEENRTKYNILQAFVKIVMNSFYGIQLQPGSFLYNPDTATYITKQARELISEMMWSMEGFLENNHGFNTFNEFVAYLTQNIATINPKPELAVYLNRPITREELYGRLVEVYRACFNNGNKNEPTHLNYLKSFSENVEEKYISHLYYRNNLHKFILENPKVKEVFFSIINGKEVFQSPDPGSDVFPKAWLPTLNLLNGLCEEFVIPRVTTSNRVYKFIHNKRRSITISDTDSIMVNLGSWVDRFNEMNGLPPNAEEDDEAYLFRMVNMMAFICTHLTVVRVEAYAQMSGVPKANWKYIRMKNEFLFRRLLMYTVKKNYVIHSRLEDGKQVDEIEKKGGKLNGYRMSPYVRKLLTEIIEFDILRKDVRQFDPTIVVKKLAAAKQEIMGRLASGDMTMGDMKRFSGRGHYADIFKEATGRGVLVWNVLFPEDSIQEYDTAYRFDTFLDDEESLSMIPDLAVRELIKQRIFHNDDPELVRLRNYGLSKICIPRDGQTKEIPVWLRPFIDASLMADKHLEPLTSLVPSLGFTKSKKSTITNLLTL